MTEPAHRDGHITMVSGETPTGTTPRRVSESPALRRESAPARFMVPHMTKHCPQENAAGLDQYHSVAAVAEALELSHWTVRDYIREGLLPAFKVGSGAKAPVRIRAADLAKLLTPITAAEVVGQSLRGP